MTTLEHKVKDWNRIKRKSMYVTAGISFLTAGVLNLFYQEAILKEKVDISSLGQFSFSCAALGAVLGYGIAAYSEYKNKLNQK